MTERNIAEEARRETAAADLANCTRAGGFTTLRLLTEDRFHYPIPPEFYGRRPGSRHWRRIGIAATVFEGDGHAILWDAITLLTGVKVHH